MNIEYGKKFVKQFDRMGKRDQKSVRDAVAKFTQDPFDPSLKNHKLHGKLAGSRSISAGYDLRIIFKEEGGYVRVLMLAVGNHNNVY